MHWKFVKNGLAQCCYPLRSLILLLIITNGHILSNCAQADCRNMQIPQECECKTRGFFLENKIRCPRLSQSSSSATSIEMVFPQNRNYLTISCKYENDSMPTVWPTIKIGKIKLVQINDCSTLAANTTMADLFGNLKLTNVSILQFKNDDFNFNLSSQQMNGLQNLTQLSLTLKNNAPLDEQLFAFLSKLKILKLRTPQAVMPKNFLAPLKALEHIELYLYNVKELSTEIFQANEQLHSLSLSQSNIAVLRKSVFKHQNALETLIIFSNIFLNTIEANIFDELSNLNVLSLNNNKIVELPPALLSNTKKLRKFLFCNKRVQLRFLPTNFLANLPLLQNVTINCHLKHLTSDIFANSTCIERLQLEENQLEIVPEDLFQHQLSLLELDLSKNLLRELPNNLFLTTTKLKALKLSNNKLKQITSFIFKPLIALETLLIDNNQLMSIDGNHFAGLMELQTICLQKNSINNAFFEKNFVKRKLKTLDISYNKLTALNLNNLLNISKQTLEINLKNNLIKTILYEKRQNAVEAEAFKNLSLILAGNPINCDCKLLGFVEFWKTQIRSNRLTCQEPASLKQKQLIKISTADLLCKVKNCPTGCNCHERTETQTMLIECYDFRNTSNKNLSIFFQSQQHSQLAIKTIELNLENNNLTQQPNLSSADFDKITTLKLAGNKFEKIYVENLPRNLTNLDLRFNNIRKLSNEMLLYFSNEKNSKKCLNLSGNPWKCDCQTLPLLNLVQKNIEIVTDKEEMHCSNMPETPFSYLQISQICPTNNHALIISLTVLIVVVLFVIAVFLYMKYNLELKIWLYSHRMLLWLVTEAELDEEDKIYDAFISYSSKDEQFVVEQLVPQLENGKPPFKLCVHYRNFLVGASIPANIANAVENSRRTIILLSKNFIESDWALHEFRSAHLSALEEKKPRVIVVLYGDIGEMDAIDAELQAYLTTKTYLAYGDAKFWDRLRYALPHIQNARNEVAMSSIRNGYAIVNRNIGFVDHIANN